MHTPGPWEFRKDQTGCWAIFADGKSIMWDAHYSPWVPDKEADWRLIAAAPELLNLLREVELHFRGYEDSDEYTKELFNRTRAAIAKATGEQQ